MAAPADKWHGTVDYDYVVAGVFFIDANGNVICQHRDDNTPNSPNLASFFGGRLEQHDETPAHGAAREANEETNRHLSHAGLELLAVYIADVRPGVREKVYVFVSRGHTTQGLRVYEGQGYHVVTSMHDLLIAPIAQPAFDAWFSQSLDARRANTYPKSNE